MREGKIISALIGLVGTCNSDPKTIDTDGLAIKALAFPLLFMICPGFMEPAMESAKGNCGPWRSSKNC